MNFKQLFKKYHRRLVIEGIISSALLGLVVGFFTTGILAALTWCFGIGSLGLAIGIGVGVLAVVGICAYILQYRPTEKDVARRIDRLGLEERAITMLELDGDDSFFARIQREDTFQSVKTIEGKKVKLFFSRLAITLAAIAFVFATASTTVLGLANADVIPSGEELLGGGEFADWIAVEYEADEGGEILGDHQQLVPPKSDTTPVVAVAHEGWMFLCWDDGLRTPERYERNVTGEISLVAIFVEVEPEDVDMELLNDKNEGDASTELPDEVPSGAMNPPQSEMEGPPNQGDPGDDSNQESDPNGAGGKWSEANQFIDGNQYYRDQLDIYYELAMEIFKDGGEIPPELREFFENYFDSI